MAPVDISTTAITSFLSSLPQVALEAASPTHLPTALPLTFPSDLHTINVLSTLHLVYTLASHPTHTEYFATSTSTPANMALRGVIGLYLASEADWTASNLLAARAWATDVITEDKVVEYFGISVMREREHESMPGVTVGERWPPAAHLAQELVALFQELGISIEASCLGEEVVALLSVARDTAGSGDDSTILFAKSFSENAVSLLPPLADLYSSPHGTILASAPLRLLQDLSHRFSGTESNATLHLPSTSALANISPLPLSIPVLIHLGILDISQSSLDGAAELRHATGDWWTARAADLFAPPPQPSTTDEKSTGNEPKVVSIPLTTYDSLARASVEACREIQSHARFAPPTSEDWKREMTMVDVARLCMALEGVMDERGMGIRLAVG